MTFRITTLLYLFALVAAGLSAFGGVGVLAVVGVLLGWASLLNWWRPGCGIVVVVATIVAVMAIALVLPAMYAVRDGGPSYQRCRNTAKSLLLFLHDYDASVGSLPPAKGVGHKGTAEQSWRVHILPYSEGTTIGQHYNFDQPWDGPGNSTFKQVYMAMYLCCLYDEETEAYYFAITGPQTAWGDGEPRKLSDVTDDLGSTILLIEAAGRGVHWAEPKDLTFGEAVTLLTTPLPANASDGHRVDHGYFYKPSYVRNVGMCDGSCRALAVPIPREAAVALLTSTGGEAIDPAWLKPYTTPQLDYARVWGVTAFALIALLPGVPRLRPWVWPIQR